MSKFQNGKELTYVSSKPKPINIREKIDLNPKQVIQEYTPTEILKDYIQPDPIPVLQLIEEEFVQTSIVKGPDPRDGVIRYTLN